MDESELAAMDALLKSASSRLREPTSAGKNVQANEKTFQRPTWSLAEEDSFDEVDLGELAAVEAAELAKRQQRGPTTPHVPPYTSF